MYKATTVMRDDNLFEATAPVGRGILMDASDGEKRGQSPMELLLSAISGCASVDVAEIMRKKRRQIKGLKIDVAADRREEHPRIFTEIRLAFELTSPDATEAELEQAVKLSMDKYCSVSGMLREAATINYTWSIRR